ncbi:MAG: phosphate ABC transporter substrate-binding/OmpA family protein [Pseudomonadota bacterium]
MKNKAIGAASAICAAVLMTAAQAQDVVLRTQDDAIRLTGELLSFDGSVYELRSEIGVVKLDAALVLCEGEACPEIEPSKDFAVTGAPGLAELILPAALSATGEDAFAVDTNGDTQVFNVTRDSESYAQIAATAKSSEAAFADLASGAGAVALTTRGANDTELQAFEAAGVLPLSESIIAVDGLAIVTPFNNPLPSISLLDVARIFSGQVQNWSELGGPDLAITRYVRGSDTLIAEVFDTLVLDLAGEELSADVVVMDSDMDLAERVANDPSAIGFKHFSDLTTARQMPIIGRCGLVVSPNAFNIRAEEYPLSFRLRAVTANRPASPFVEELMARIPSQQVQDALAESGVMSQTLTRSPVDQQGMRFASALQSRKIVDALPRLQAMVTEMVVSERLSSTFRFESGSRTLDERGERDIERVAELLMQETSDGSGKTVRVIGFTDSLGDPTLNQELSERRAQQVLDALLAAEPALAERVDLRPMGFGDVSPIGCDQSTTGRWINRRVEIWISAATR